MKDILDQWEAYSDPTIVQHQRLSKLIAVVRKQREALCVFHNWMNDRSINLPECEIVKISRTVMEVELERVTEAERILKG